MKAVVCSGDASASKDAFFALGDIASAGVSSASKSLDESLTLYFRETINGSLGSE